MLRTVAKKVAWVGRTASMVFGLALVMALVFGVATMALAAVPGDPFRLGQVNVINTASPGRQPQQLHAQDHQQLRRP